MTARRLRRCRPALLVLTAAAAIALALLGSPASPSPASPASGHYARAGSVRVTLVALPPIVQPGIRPTAPLDTTSLVAMFEPTRRGQVVVLERASNSGWRVVDTARQDAWGSAAFSERRGTFRVRTVAGGRSWASGPVRARRFTSSLEDTFDTGSLDSAIWNDQVREHESEYGPRTCARVDSAARDLGGGVLRLGVGLDPARLGMICAYDWGRTAGESPYVLNTQVATEHTFTFVHGIAAARMKLQRADGMHSAFWMLPRGTQFVESDPAQGAEIDVMEFWGDRGSSRETIGSFVGYRGPEWSSHRYGGKFPEARRALGAGREWWHEFHVFSVEWTPTEYVFRVDGREYYRERRSVSQVPQYLVLSMLTADYELDDLDLRHLGHGAQVDWVRVFDASSRQSVRTATARPHRD